MNIALWLARLGIQEPSLPAIGHGRKAVATYGELSAKAAHLSGALVDELGVKPGDRIAIAAWNEPD
ncbi:MAG: long-chain fatty acid--CoA ligase, partial [Rhizobiales bacterium]|nr:long-chain fatty acid--CoA ligase [Hyphomicrobiales bacterium]